MLFNSLHFLIFFPAVVSLYYALPYRFRNGVLLIASAYFYAVFVPRYLVVIFSLIAMDYILALILQGKTGRKRNLLFCASIAVNLGALLFFKYFNFLSLNIAAVADFLHFNYAPTLLNIILPLGLSFHIFQSLSYVIEVYRGKFPAEKNIIRYALYVMFFPQLVAGPIERPQNLLPQLTLPHDFDAAETRKGLERMLWGFFKKIVIADNLATYVNAVYAHPESYAGGAFIAATVFFAFQIYCDFSGYSDIALGSARILGVKLMENFDRPFLSRSVAEFWRRWHISLSSWLRDYLYYPLAFWGKGSVALRTYRALLTTFVLIGLWHGANWTFVVFGAMHGLYVVFGQVSGTARRIAAERLGVLAHPNIHHMMQTATTFTLVCIGFIFFRADSMKTSLYIILQSLQGVWDLLCAFGALVYPADTAPLLEFLHSLFLPAGRLHFIVYVLAIAVFFASEVIEYNTHASQTLGRQSRTVRWVIYLLLALSIMNLSTTKEIPFIYFQF